MCKIIFRILILIFAPIRSLRPYYAFVLLCVYLFALLPKDIGHIHKIIHDENHTAAEHCENVIYDVVVSDAHKCGHKFHIHNTPPHCFACDSHCTSIHTKHSLSIFFVSVKNITTCYNYILPAHEILSSRIYNKGPPDIS